MTVPDYDSNNADEELLQNALEKVLFQTNIVIPGRIVHFQKDDECRAAIIVKVWNQTTVNLTWFGNLVNDEGWFGSKTLLALDKETSVVYGLGLNQWHWPTECPHLKELVNAGVPL